jgi:guanyl-specific ribonuclease Sa
VVPVRRAASIFRMALCVAALALAGGASVSAGAPCGTADAAAIVHDVEIVDHDGGRVLHRGDVDLRATLRRIEAGDPAPVGRDDGTAFCARGLDRGRFDDPAYGEYVVLPTYLRGRSPGPQRVIVGTASGRAFYSCDHYRTFVALAPRVALPADRRVAIERQSRERCRSR